MDNQEMEEYRYFLKDHIRMETDFTETGQGLGLEPPPLEKGYPPGGKIMKLPKPDNWSNIGAKPLTEAIGSRRSRRRFSKKPLNLEELSFLLWATQGVSRQIKRSVLRNVPSAGNRHPFETYLAILNVQGAQPGIYIYLPLEHQLAQIEKYQKEKLIEKLGVAAMGQFFVGMSSAVFIWAAIPYRTEWRYGKASHKVIAIDAGHICQNLYLACEAIDAGTCAIAAYNQDLMDSLAGLDGKDEFVVYLAPVGKLK